MQFGSDNQTGASQKVLETLANANDGHTHGYGDDQWTQAASDKINQVFETEASIYFVATGTAANSLALASLVNPWETILCHHQAHVFIDESTAPEFFSGGARQIPVTQKSGKLHTSHLENYFSQAGSDTPHNVIPKALSIAQANESGLVYSVDELTALSKVAHQHQIKLHVDGARFANAVAATKATPAELSWKAGVDVLCLGATKCGCLAAEAVIFFDQALAKDFEHRRKRSGHLLSKGRLFAAQFLGWLEDDHWLELARHANQHASELSQQLEQLENVRLAWPTQANEVLAIMPTTMVNTLQQAGAEFYPWYEQSLPPREQLNQDETLIRLVTSFKSNMDEVTRFIDIANNSKHTHVTGP